MSIDDILKTYGITIKELSRLTGIPYDTLSQWHRGTRTPKEWMINLIVYYLAHELPRPLNKINLADAAKREL